MFRLKRLLLIAALILPVHLCCQQPTTFSDFSSLDSFARTIKYKNDIYSLTKELTSSYSEQLLKLRAIFIWITENIRYDYKLYNKQKEPKTPKCKSGINCEQIMIAWETKYINKVLKKRKGICDGYSRLLKKMCDIAGIKAEIITGYSKTKPYQIGNAGSVDHAWNAVWLDSAYYLLDPTWAAGVCAEDEETGKLSGFKKQFDNYYWLTPFNDFTRNHYPQNVKWVFEANYTKEKFAANPFYASDIISQIKLVSPSSGIINARKGDTIHFSLEFSGSLKYLQINSNIFHNPAIWTLEPISKRKKVWKEDTIALKKQKYTAYKTNGNRLDFDYVVTDNSLYYLDILFDYRRVMRFKVIIHKKDL